MGRCKGSTDIAGTGRKSSNSQRDLSIASRKSIMIALQLVSGKNLWIHKDSRLDIVRRDDAVLEYRWVLLSGLRCFLSMYTTEH